MEQKWTKPTLLLDETKCRRNIQCMVQKAAKHKIRLRPHFKTHQSLEIGRWFRQEGVQCATVSSLTMAKYFSVMVDDITVAFPLNVHEVDTVSELLVANPKLQLGLTVENTQALDVLAARLCQGQVRIWIKVDAGNHRTGIPVEQVDRIQHLLNVAAQHSTCMIPMGVLIHSGHTYKTTCKESIQQIHMDTLAALTRLREQLVVPQGRDGLEYSIGDTPSCSVMDTFDGATELRPGNYVFYDVEQHFLGSNPLESIAVCLVCPVVAKHVERHEIVLYGGAVHLSKDSISRNGVTVYGLPVSVSSNKGWTAEPWKDSYVIKLSQEHGVVRVNAEQFDRIEIGDWIGILPIHSCLTADVMGEYVTLDGKRIDHMRRHMFS